MKPGGLQAPQVAPCLRLPRLGLAFFLSLFCIEINSGEKVLPHCLRLHQVDAGLGFKQPFLFNLNLVLESMCL